MPGDGHVLHTCETNEVFCRQGLPADCLYILRKGRVGIYINGVNGTPHALTDSEILESGIRVATLDTTGSFIGEGGVFLKHRTASLVALTPDTAIEHVPLDTGGLSKVMAERPQLSLTLCRSLATRLSEVTEKVRDVAYAADTMARAFDNLSLEFVRLVNLLQHKGEEYLSLATIADEFTECPLYCHGKTLEMHRNTTCRIFKHATTQQRSGNMTLEKGQVLCEEGSMGRALYLVRSGKLEVKLGSLSLTDIGTDEIVGEIAVILKETPRRTATVRAVTDTKLMCISMVKFYEIAEKQPEFLVPIARSLATRLDTTNQLLCQRKQQSTHEVTLLTGGTFSCSSQFDKFAKRLAAFPEASEIESAARRNVTKAQHLQEGLHAATNASVTEENTPF